jgi:hypothetical protein
LVVNPIRHKNALSYISAEVTSRPSTRLFYAKTSSTHTATQHNGLQIKAMKFSTIHSHTYTDTHYTHKFATGPHLLNKQASRNDEQWLSQVVFYCPGGGGIALFMAGVSERVGVQQIETTTACHTQRCIDFTDEYIYFFQECFRAHVLQGKSALHFYCTLESRTAWTWRDEILYCSQSLLQRRLCMGFIVSLTSVSCCWRNVTSKNASDAVP